MKKLMTMIAAVATSFGLFADEPAAAEAYSNYVDFVNAPVVEGTNHYDWQKVTGWSYAGAADTLTVADSLLTIKTGSNALSRLNNEPIDEEKGLFLDTVIDFKNQSLEDLPEVTDGKIAIFVYDNSEDEAAVAAGKVGTNLYVIAGYGADSKALYKIASVDETWFSLPKRITVKAYQNVAASGDACGGYMIYVEEDMQMALAGYNFNNDGKTIDWANEFDSNYLGAGAPPIKSALSGWASDANRNLFLSLDRAPNTTVSLNAVDFTGNAILTYVTLTDEKMDFISSDANTMGVTWDDANVTISEVKGVGVAWDETAKTITVPAGATPEITMTVDYPAGYVFKASLNGEKVVEDNKTLTFDFVKDATLTLSAEAEAAKVFDASGNPVLDTDDYPFTDFDAAFAAAAAISGAKIELAASQNVGMLTVSENLTIDLKGQTITGIGGEAACAIYVGAGTLTIDDSSDAQAGKVLASGEGVSAVLVEDAAALIIKAGTFDGDVAMNGEFENAISATAGKFMQSDVMTKNAVKEFIEGQEDKYEVTGEEGETYWTIKEIEYTDISDADVTLSPASITYGDAAPTVTAITLNSEPLDLEDFDVDFGDYEVGSDVGEYAVTVTPKDGTRYSGKATAKFTVVQKAIAVPEAASLTYNGTEQTGVAEGEGYDITGNTGTNAKTDYEATLTLTDAKNTKWANDTFGGTIQWSIAKAQLTVTATNETITAGETAPLGYEVSGTLYFEDKLTGALATDPADYSKAGDYDIVKGTLTAGDNYAIIFNGATLTVVAAPAPVDPVKPGEKKEYTDAGEASKAATDFNNMSAADKANAMAVPECVTDKAAYAGLFTATADGKFVSYDLSEAAQTTISGELNASEGQILNPTGTDGKAVLTAKPGLWYGIAADDELVLGSEQVPTWVQATGNTVEVAVPEVTIVGGAKSPKAFFKPICSAAQKQP